MNVIPRAGLAGMLALLLGSPVSAEQGYLTAQGGLTQELLVEVTETGGFVGVQSYSFHIAPQGGFTRRYAIGSGPLRETSGTLSHAQLAALGEALQRSNLQQLPAQIVGQAKPPAGSADIPTINAVIRWGNQRVTAQFVMGGNESQPAAQQIAAVNQILTAVRKATSAR